MPTFRRALTALAAPALLLANAAGAHAQARVTYEIAFPNAVHHEAQVTATFAGVPAGRPLQVRMSRSSPGRYALHEFAKNVYGVHAFDGAGRPLSFTRPNPHEWDVAGHDGTVRMTYTLYGDRTDGTYAGIDASHAHLNMPAAFMWARGLDAAPIRVTFHRAPGWSVATQLMPTADSATFTAPNLQYFMDSPTEVGPVRWRTWHQKNGATDVTVRMAMHHLGTDAELDAFAEMAKKTVAEEAAVFGGMPSDRGVYTFIVDYLPWANGDGMEHRNSTIITSPRPLSTGAMDNIGTVSHEFFHQWNVERIRPKALEPFNFEEANMSGELWFAEGFTSYYDALFLRRAGIYNDSAYADDVTGNVTTVLNAPGRRLFSAVEMSMQAPFVDAAASIDPQNRQNTFISYYTFGAALGLGLDLTLRERFPNVTLDDYMRAMWQQHGRFQSAALAPERPYTLADLRRVLGQLTGDAAFANDFFDRYVQGHEALDYERLLAPAGFLVRKAHAGAPWLGTGFVDDDGVIVASGPVVGGSFYRAGIDREDRIVSIAGQAATTADAVRTALLAHRPGETVPVEVEQRGVRRTVNVTLVENPAVEVVPYEAAGRPVTDEMRAFRARWLGSKAGM
jgi:predicted metalloprotease with PDZ domain